MDMVVLWWLLAACGGPDPRCPAEGRALSCDDATTLTCDDGHLVDEQVCGAADACVDGAGCVTCELSLPASLGVPIDPAEAVVGQGWRTLAWTPLSLEGMGTVAVETTGSVIVTDADATPIVEVELPATVYLRATTGGTAAVGFRTACGELATVELVARAWPGLSVSALPSFPYATPADVFPAGGTLRVAVDPSRVPQAVGSHGAIWVVADRHRDAWLEDPVLVDAADGPVPFPLVPGGRAENLVEVWRDLPVPHGAIGRYDLVWDVDADGSLSPGDVVDGLDGPGFAVLGDLSAPGPYTPVTRDLSASYWLTQRIWWPEEIAGFAEPAPLVVISHGNGMDYDWYDYLGAHLASHGYVVTSHRNNTAPGVESAASTTLENTDAFVRNHGILEPSLEGRVDVGRIAWIGHSRGGEGVLLAYDRLVDGTANVQALAPEHVALISTIAPTVFTGPGQARAGDRPYHLMAGSADGDVTGGVGDPVIGASCGFCQWSRLRQGATGLQAVTYLQGASHNDFCALGVDDGWAVDAPRFGKPAVLAHTRALYVALLGAVVRGDPVLREVLSSDPEVRLLPRPEGTVVAAQYRAEPSRRRVLDDFQGAADPATSSAGTAVRATVEGLVEGPLDDANAVFTHDPSDPMNGMTESHQDPVALRSSGAVLGWSSDAVWEVDLPDDARDLTVWRVLSLRVAQLSRHPVTDELGDALSFGVALVDARGQEVVLDGAAYGRVPAPTPRSGLGLGAGWANEFATIRVPLGDFEVEPFDRANVRSVRLRFGPSHGSPIGRIGLDDIALEAR